MSRMHRTSASVRAALLACALALAAPSVLADPPEGKGRGNKHKNEHSERGERNDRSDSGPSVGVLISAGITAAIAHQYALDSGIRSGAYKPLPPGIRKNLARGKPLPPGIAKKSAPSAMLGRLPRHPGYEWQMAGTDLVLVQIGTAIIADVLRDVFR
ncbi:MAG TPA: anti-virulence regulator CigR family protein [Azospira sp.]|nr:anti-virulence regulator CigR family protein [Azospira sp.]